MCCCGDEEGCDGDGGNSVSLRPPRLGGGGGGSSAAELGGGTQELQSSGDLRVRGLAHRCGEQHCCLPGPVLRGGAGPRAGSLRGGVSHAWSRPMVRRQAPCRFPG